MCATGFRELRAPLDHYFHFPGEGPGKQNNHILRRHFPSLATVTLGTLRPARALALKDRGEVVMQKTRIQRTVLPTRKEVLDRIADEYELESLRQAVRRELRTHGGQRTLATALGLSRAVIRKFVEMRSVPTPENLQVLRDWAADRPDVETPLGPVCLALLAADVAPALRYEARLRLAEALAQICGRVDEPMHAWLAQELRDRRAS